MPTPLSQSQMSRVQSLRAVQILLQQNLPEGAPLSDSLFEYLDFQPYFLLLPFQLLSHQGATQCCSIVYKI